MNKRPIISIILFIIIVTGLSLYFQWNEFYNYYSFSEFNLHVSITFILAWIIFSVCFRLSFNKRYYKYIFIYWYIGALVAFGIYVFHINKYSELIPRLFYIWYEGPFFGFTTINKGFIPIETYIILGIFSSYFSYYLGNEVSKRVKASNKQRGETNSIC